ncbi:MAG TPA: 30S ribosomal protein S12 methylthiotransferase RimO [Candidatus Bathyarchaeia archaeon]|nr:30S ribosomal protein S12 methylthiotransferase RimO [Candidatus Bathyarchaeia archaeon]
MRIGLITLGCDKNTVDNEYIAGLFEARGCRVVFEPTPGGAALDAVVVLTCGFIADATRQSVEALVAWAEHKAKTGSPRLYAAGCLSQRHAAELLEAIPEIDGVAGVGQFGRLVDLVTADRQPRNVTRRAPLVEITSSMPRRRADARPWSFLKIADGCNHACTFCSIPLMKGPLRSVPREILLEEARGLVAGGVREITLVAQDISVYGRDWEKMGTVPLFPGSNSFSRADLCGEIRAPSPFLGYGLPDLLRDLCAIPGDFWIRCMYCYPGGITRELLDVMASEPKVVPYLDVPLQHLDPEILRRMRRPFANVNPRRLVDRLRGAVPGIAIRTTMIVGFPGETPVQHRRMLDGIRDLRFDWLGAFPYSNEPDTPAASAPRQVGKAVRQKRWENVMAVQAEISEEINRSRIGGVERVLVEGYDENRKSWVGRTAREAPEVDGLVLLKSARKLLPGRFVNVKVTSADVYDVTGRVV